MGIRIYVCLVFFLGSKNEQLVFAIKQIASCQVPVCEADVSRFYRKAGINAKVKFQLLSSRGKGLDTDRSTGPE